MMLWVREVKCREGGYVERAAVCDVVSVQVGSLPATLAPLVSWAVEGGGDVLCAYPCLVLEGCRGVVGIVVRGAFPRRDA